MNARERREAQRIRFMLQTLALAAAAAAAAQILAGQVAS